MSEDNTPAQRRRPRGSTTGQLPLRTLKMGPLWEQGKAAAKEHGYRTMTALVEEALREKLARLERQGQRQADG